LRISAGNVRQLKAVYRSAPLFDGLRDPANLKGKCNDCEFKELCGGSRARAWQ
jgi:radical SAM protein with 4Fe4S-binding SPASM domain